tara:strand:- start:1118 stop:1297 length:180 start_codon:yes stop_codon:yes gene_type:complete
MKTNIVYVLHMADFMASKVEYDIWLKSTGGATPKVQKTNSTTGKRVNSSDGLTNMLKNL